MISKIIEHTSPGNEPIAIIQLYAASVLLLTAVASFLAVNTIDFIVVAKILATCFTLVGLYSVLFRISGQQGVSALVLIGILTALPLMPYLRYAVYVFGVLGLFTLFRPGLKIGFNDLISLPILFVAIFGAHIYSYFVYQDYLLGNSIHIDTLFHAAIAAMYSNYGIASVGLDGLVPITYHTLSHKIISGSAKIGGFEALAGYSYLYFALAPLLLAFSLAGFACQLNSKLKFTQALLGISLLILAIISIPVFARAALWDSFFVSESYLIALVILIASLSTFIRWIENGAVGLPQLATSLALLILSGLTKGSVGVVGIFVFGLLGITKFRFFRYWFLLAISSALMYFSAIDVATNAKQVSSINLFHFVNTYTKAPFYVTATWSKVIFFLGVHFLPVWACFVIGLRKSGFGYFKTIEFQILFALLVSALFFSLTFELAGGAAYYFSSIPVILSLSFLLSSLFHLLNAINFKHIIVLAIFSSLIMDDAISDKSSMKKLRGNVANIDGLQAIVKQLHAIRDNSPINILVKIENPEELVGKIGCNAYWFLPAVMERPMIDGLPKNDLCYSGFYGLSNYKANENKMIPKDFKVVRVRLGPQ